MPARHLNWNNSGSADVLEAPCHVERNHIAMVAVHAVYYNFARIHKTLRITPAMPARLSDHVWSLDEIVTMADSYMPKPGKRGPYKKTA
ncbi:MAG: hypothetical protein WAL71_05575 [Terriglobales bacterium]